MAHKGIQRAARKQRLSTAERIERTQEERVQRHNRKLEREYQKAN